MGVYNHISIAEFWRSFWHRLAVDALILGLVGAALDSKAQPVLSSDLGNQVVIPGTPVVLQISASDANPLIYQWYFNGTIISGATNASLYFDSIQPTNAGRYRV